MYLPGEINAMLPTIRNCPKPESLPRTLAPLKETEGGGDVFVDCDDLTDLTRQHAV